MPRRPYFTLLITAVILIVTGIVIVAISDSDDKPSSDDSSTIFHTPLKHVWNANDQNNSTIRWSRIDRRAEIEIEISSKTTGYIGVVFFRGKEGEPGAIRDIILAGYDDDKQNGFIEDRYDDVSAPGPHEGNGKLDDRQDVELLWAKYEAPWTVVRFRRKLDTEDEQDAAINGREGQFSLALVSGHTDDDTGHPHEIPLLTVLQWN